MSCVLRISGTNLDIDALLAGTSLVPGGIYRRGEPRSRSKPDGKKNSTSGVNFLVSNADFDDFEAQKMGAIVFLKANQAEIQRIMAYPGVEGGSLDFGIWRRDDVVQSDFFPSDLLKAAGCLGVDIVLSQYPKT